MRIWTKTTGLIFCALLAVYNGPAAFSAGETQAGSADSASKVKVIGDAADPAAPDAPSPTRVVASDSGTFSIQISNDDSLIHVLRLIGDEAQRSIIPSREVRGTVPAMDLNNVTLSEALDAILQSNGMAWQQKGNLIFVYTQKELADREKAARKAATKTFTLHYIPAADAEALIKPAESADAQVAITKDAISGIDTGDGGTASGGGAGTSVGTGGNSESGVDMIVVTDYPENLEQISKIIQEVDRRPVQILVEATIFEATLNDNNSMGIDFSLMGGVNFADLIASGTPLTSALSGTILNAVSSTGSGTASGTPTASSLVRQGYAGGTSGNYDQNVPPGGLQIGIVHDNLGVFISALESVADTTVLANPKVLVLNKQAGEVHVGQELGYQTTTVTQTTSTQTVQYLDTGTILSFRPFVGDDGYVRMEIHPEDSTGSVTNNLPSKTTSEVTSNVMIKDGNTIVIGGLFREVSQSSRNQVPILGEIPVVGALFRSKTDQTQRQEIIILLTPHIIKDDSSYNKASLEEMKEAERERVGMRKGMMWFGRERLAETAYENAVAEMAKPKPNVNLALWHLDCAINLNPKFAEAIDLKEKITGVQVTDVDNSTIRGFVRGQIMAETAVEPATRPAMAIVR
ncbi:MAG: hypothetical protein ABSD28_00400 [Tepidisphaeraceae bacterium]|jgi:type IV pilus secretin PilQ/predicted competence protein